MTCALAGKPLRYLIGADDPGNGRDGEITECGYDVSTPPAHGIAVKYCNLFDEKNSGRYGPYLRSSDTAAEYEEGQIDPRGAGWVANLTDQFERAIRQGFRYIEIDNPDAYSVTDVVAAVKLAAGYGLAVIAKNPLLMDDDPTSYVADCCGAIVERGAGNPHDMHTLRVRAGKPDLPVWFVAFGNGRAWAEAVAHQVRAFHDMRVTYSISAEYGSSQDL